MLYNNLVAQNSGVDIEQMICLVHEKIDVLAFQQAWQRVVERHAVLRTSFDWESEREPQQCVHQNVIIPLEEQDWCGLSDTEQSTKLQVYLQSDRQRGLALKDGTCTHIRGIRYFLTYSFQPSERT
ncbi:MAG: condensation domain-containing protein [Gloeotrichia echinulata IR180]|jgi:hypothetical protein